MNLQELQNFLTLAEQLHFGRASQICNLSPSALSRSIQRTEQALGHPLFIRDNRTVTLTTAGEKFRTYATHTIREWENLHASLNETHKLAGNLSIYASVTATHSIIPQLLDSYRQLHPDVHLELRTGSEESAIEQVISGEIDLSIAALPDRKPSNLNFLPLTQTNLVFVTLTSQLSLYPTSPTSPLNLANTPLVIPRTGLARQRINKLLKQKNITPNITTEVSGNEGILAMVRLGCGIGIVPELVLDRSPLKNDLSIIPHTPSLTPYTVGLCTTNKNLRQPNTTALWNLATEQKHAS